MIIYYNYLNYEVKIYNFDSHCLLELINKHNRIKYKNLLYVNNIDFIKETTSI
jgi:hypothetical protein